MRENPASSKERGESGPDKRPPGLRVLLAEDNSINRLAIKGILQSEGHQVTAVGNGAEALAALEKESFDLVLMDVEMPVMNGIEAVRRIRSDRTGKYDPDITVVAITAHDMQEDRDMTIEAGMDGHITKPVDLSELRIVLRKTGRQEL